jgi:hypothetical protein
MEELEIFDKNGKTINNKDVIGTFLKDNLTIEISTSTIRDYGDTYTNIEVSISLDGEEICKSGDRI